MRADEPKPIIAEGESTAGRTFDPLSVVFSLRCQHEQGASDIGDFSSWGKPACSGKSNNSKSRADTDQPGARDRVGEGAFHGYQVDDKQSRWLARALRNRA